MKQNETGLKSRVRRKHCELLEGTPSQRVLFGRQPQEWTLKIILSASSDRGLS